MPALLLNWLIIRMSLAGGVSYHLSGIVFRHPRIPDQHQAVTSVLRELGADSSWARTRSRLYELQKPLSPCLIDAELKSEIREIVSGWPIESIDYGVEWPGARTNSPMPGA